MASVGNTRETDSGFALITVLLGVAVLTVLVSASMSRTMAHVMTAKQATARHHSELQREALLPLITAHIQADKVPGQVYTPRAYRLEIFGAERELFVTDTVGLVDVNTADVELLRAILEPHLDAEALNETIAALKLRRKQRRRFTSVDGFLKAVGLQREAVSKLRPVLTTRSGLRWPIEEAMSEEVHGNVLPRDSEWTTLIIGQGWVVRREEW